MLKKSLLMAVMFVLCLNIALANDYEIKDVAVNGIFLNNETLALQTGERLQVDVWVKGLNELDNVKVKAWIATNEISEIYAETDAFDIKGDVVYRKELYLDVPEDLTLNNNNFKLYVEVYDKSSYVQKSYPVFVNEKMHDVVVQDVIVRPSTMLKAGDDFVVQARIENLGSKKERNLRIEASLPELNVNAVTWVDALEMRDEDGSSVSTPFMPLILPENVMTGDYQLKITVKYNKLNSETVETRLVHIEGNSNEEISEKVQDSVVAVSVNNEAVVGEVSHYKVAIANIGDKKKEYKIEFSADWADSEVLPETFELMPGTGSEAIIALNPTQAGKFQANIKVYDGDVLIKESVVNVKVNAKVKEESFKFSLPESFKDNRNKVLLAMIIVLVFALIMALKPGLKPHPVHRI